MIKHKDSHLDHGLTEAQIAYLLERFADRDAFFIETIELPTELGTVPCGLYGPTMGDSDIVEAEVFYAKRAKRNYETRFIDRPLRQVYTVTVVAGPYDDQPCVLFTAYGGPAAPREPGDPSVEDVGEMAKTFWAKHALAFT